MFRYVLLVLLLASCGPASKLRKAQHLIDAAVAKGAKVTTDTTYKIVSLVAPPMTMETTLTPPKDWNELLVKGKESIVVHVKRIPAKGKEPEKIYIKADCPPQKIPTKIPVAINQKIAAGYTLWDLVILAIVCLIVGYISNIFIQTIKIYIKQLKENQK